MSNMSKMQRARMEPKNYKLIYLPCYIYILLILLMVSNNNILNQYVKYHELLVCSVSTMRRAIQ
jgi:hypothetical protein